MGLKESGLRGSLRNVSVGIDAIPDSVASRPDDDGDTTGPESAGAQVETKSVWPSVGARISANVDGATKAYIYEDDDNSQGQLIDDVDISSLTAGDAFTFDDVNLESNSKYHITIDAEGSEYTRGGNSDTANTYPYTSDDIDISARVFDGSASTDADIFNIVEVGNVGFD